MNRGMSAQVFAGFRPRFWQDGSLLLLTLIIGLGGSWLLFRAIVHSETIQRQEQLYVMGQSVVGQLDLNLSRRLEAIRGASLMVASQLTLERTEFNRYARTVVDDSHNFTFIEWQPRVAQGDLATFEGQAAAQGLAGFRVLEPFGKLWRPVQARDEYLPVLFAWPEHGRQLGADSALDQSLSRARRKARDTGGIASTEISDIPPSTNADGVAERGFMVTAAVYMGNAPASIDARRQALRGYVAGMISFSSVLQSAIFNADAADLDLLVIDPAGEGSKLMYGARGDNSDLPANLAGDYATRPHDLVLTVEVGARPWELVLHPRPAFFLRQTNSNASMTLIGGVIATLLLVATLAFTQRSRRMLERTQQATLAAEHALAQERQRLSNIIEGTHAGTWEWYGPTGELKVNQRCAEMLGYRLDELRLNNGERWHELCHPDDWQHVIKLMQQHFSGELAYYDCEHRLRHKDGHWVWILSRGKVSSWLADGKPEWMYGTYMDISERKSLDDLKGEFVSTVSHELRTPLTSIRGALGLVVAEALGPVPAQAKQILSIAHKNALRLGYLVDDLLDMEKLLAGKMQLVLETQPLMPLIEQALESVAAYAQEYQVRMVLRERLDGAQVAVEAVRLQQVLSNFLSNAAKFSPQGSEVLLRVHYVGESSVRVEVIDHGPGIPAEFHKRIFQKFAQADSSDTRKKGGTGLGLAISKELIERMQGRIGFISVPGQGATFFFELPLA